MGLESLFLIIILGILSGVFTGLIPGIHINMVSTFLFINLVYFLKFFQLEFIIVFIIVMSLTHTFIDFIPSVLFGVPSSDASALSILPGHKLVLKGEGYKAIFLSSMGSLFGVFFSFLVIPLMFLFLGDLYSFLNKYLSYLLVLTIIILVLTEENKNKKFWAFILVLFSGGFGVFVLNSKMIYEPLLILFTGLFGISTIFCSLRENNSFPEQKFDFDFKFSFDFFKSVLVGGVASAVCSVLPGIGNSQAATISSMFFKKLNSEFFIVVLSAINTIGFVVSIVTFYLIDRARNGSVIVISQIVPSISFENLKFYFLIIFVVAFLIFWLTLLLGKNIIKIMSKINVKMFNVFIILFLIFLVFFVTGMIGVLVLFAASFLGVLCISLEVKRVHLMSVLIIPIIFNLVL